MNSTDGNGTLLPGNFHPAAHSAMDFVKEYLSNDIKGAFRLFRYLKAKGIEGNSLAEVCAGTIQRIINGEDVSDRYLLGLAWTIKYMEENTRKAS